MAKKKVKNLFVSGDCSFCDQWDCEKQDTCKRHLKHYGFKNLVWMSMTKWSMTKCGEELESYINLYE